MQINIVGRHHSLTSELRDYVKEKVLRLEKFFSGMVKSEIVFDTERAKPRVEIVLGLRRGTILVARVKGDDLRPVIDKAVEKLERQLSKHKARMGKKRRTEPQLLEKEEKEKGEPAEIEDWY